MEDAAKTWVMELTRAGNDLSLAAHLLEKSFEGLPEEGEDSKSIPNPVKLLRRICALETSIQRLRTDCQGISEIRNELILDVVEIQTKNKKALRQLSDRVEGSRRHRSSVSRSQREWETVAKQVETQHKLFLQPKEQNLERKH